MEMNWRNFLWEVGKILTDNPNFSLDFSQDTKTQVDALAWWAIQLMWATAKIWQRNLTSVLLRAIDKISNDDGIKKIDEDKLIRLIHLSTQFSSEEMQEYVSWILAWEYNQPWSFSFKTLEIVRSLGKDDIEIFRKFWWIIFDGKDFFSHFYNWGTEWNRIMYQEWIWYDSYLRLIELGLVLKIDSVQSIWIDESDLPSDISANLPPSVLLALQQNPEISYLYRIQGQELSLKKKGKSRLQWLWSLTLAWKELFPIIWFEKNDTLFQLVKSEFIKQWFYE